MLRLAVGSGMAAIGYLLVYAGVTAGGTYALRPWDALSPQASWPVNASGQGSSSGGGGGFGGFLHGAEKILGGLFGGPFSGVPLPIP